MLDENPILRPSAEEILNVLKRIQRKDIHLSKFLEETKLDFLIREVRRRKSLP